MGRITALLLLATVLPVAFAADSDEELAKKLTNPVADLISVPFQYTGTANSGPLEKPQHTLNIQPVYPTKLGAEWNLINRAIVPLLSNPGFVTGEDRENGLGDVVYEGFFSPTPRPGAPIWGVGPIVQLPTATDDRLGSGKWATGPTAVLLVQPGKWTVGALASQLWSFAGDSDRSDVNQFQIQPILSYRLSPTHSIAYAGTLVANWKEDSDNRWTVPLGATYSILTRPSWIATPVNYIFGGGKNVVRPDGVGDWYLRFQVNFVFPK
jgi:hypothetical protein